MNKIIKLNQKSDVSEIDTKSETIDLSAGNLLDISSMNQEAQALMKQKVAETQLDIHRKAQEAQLELQGTRIQLDNLSSTVRESTKDGTSTTITHTQTTTLGRTEVIMGNTEKAAEGKITRSGAGLEDNTMKVVIVIAIVALLVVLLVK
jgi:uncharacterized protein with beta-barrel porin domain